MRSINIQADIEAVLTQYVRCVPDIFLEFGENVEVFYNDGVFEIVQALDEDNEVVLGEITLDGDLVASFEIFESENEVF